MGLAIQVLQYTWCTTQHEHEKHEQPRRRQECVHTTVLCTLADTDWQLLPLFAIGADAGGMCGACDGSGTGVPLTLVLVVLQALRLEVTVVPPLALVLFIGTPGASVGPDSGRRIVSARRVMCVVGHMPRKSTSAAAGAGDIQKTGPAITARPTPRPRWLWVRGRTPPPPSAPHLKWVRQFRPNRFFLRPTALQPFCMDPETAFRLPVTAVAAALETPLQPHLPSSAALPPPPPRPPHTTATNIPWRCGSTPFLGFEGLTYPQYNDGPPAENQLCFVGGVVAGA